MTSTRHTGDILEELLLGYIKPFDPLARKTSNSGATRGDGDIHTSFFAIDCKHYPKAKNFNVSFVDLEKSRKQADRAHLPFGAVATMITNNQIAVTIPLAHFIELCETLAQYERDKNTTSQLPSEIPQ